MLLLLLACTKPTPVDSQDSSVELPDAWVEHYRAESLITTTSGFEFEEEYLVRRSLDPAASTIDEEFVATADGTETGVHFEVDAAAGSFTLSFSDESYSGTGNLYGEAWAWTGWDSHSVATDGSWVDSTDTKDAAGIRSSKVGYSAEGEQEWTLVEDLSPLTEEEWQAAMDALL